mmetsp:Transcript_97582/g.217697  ORF Transcript_97582/g.217697 Transcript_97582/m.217697 type:complete len:91 (+) Transcript_97582:38-310(+)
MGPCAGRPGFHLALSEAFDRSAEVPTEWTWSKTVVLSSASSVVLACEDIPEELLGVAAGLADAADAAAAPLYSLQITCQLPREMLTTVPL